MMRHLVETTADDLQYRAHQAGADIEVDTAESRAYLRIGERTYWAALVAVTS
jgi:hypothetical protein